MRVTEANNRANFISRINAQQSRLNMLQERISTGKKINRPSDDPQGAEAVLNIRTSQAEINQFKRTADMANQKLVAADDSLNGYENILENVRTLVSKGMSGTTTQSARDSVATELEALRDRILNVANTKYGEEYLFGGSRQNAAPFDPTTDAQSTVPTAAQYVQIEPGTNAIATGVTADTVFADSNSDIFTDLNNAISALRGTGNETTDKATLTNTMSRLTTYVNLASTAHAKIGANMNISEMAQDRLGNDFLSFEDRANAIEGDNFAETAVSLAETQKVLDATLQATAANRRTLFDFIG